MGAKDTVKDGPTRSAAVCLVEIFETGGGLMGVTAGKGILDQPELPIRAQQRFTAEMSDVLQRDLAYKLLIGLILSLEVKRLCQFYNNWGLIGAQRDE